MVPRIRNKPINFTFHGYREKLMHGGNDFLKKLVICLVRVEDSLKGAMFPCKGA
jgi:hypothetical protein